MLGMLLSFQRSWFSFTCGSSVPTVITLTVTVAIVSEKVPWLVVLTQKVACLLCNLAGNPLAQMMCSCALTHCRPHWILTVYSWREQASASSADWSFSLEEAYHNICTWSMCFPSCSPALHRFHTCFVKRENIPSFEPRRKWLSWQQQVLSSETWLTFKKLAEQICCWDAIQYHHSSFGCQLLKWI